MNIKNMTVNEINTLYRKHTSLEELNQEIVNLAKAADSKFDIFISLDDEYVAGAVGRLSLIKTGEKDSLVGIPAVLGDNICTKKLKTTCGSKILEDYLSPFNAFAVDKLLEAGVIITGKTNIDEFGIGDARGISHFAQSKNPLETGRTSGSGAACAVAAGAAVFGLGSDARGGLRQSAAYCGTAGLKPTYGRVSRYGLVDYAPSLDQIGILGKTARDIALVLECISGKDIRDAANVDYPGPVYAGDIESKETKFKIGVPVEWPNSDSLETEVKNLFNEELEKLKDIGFEIVDIKLPSLPHSAAVASIIGAVEASSNLANYDGIRFGFRADGSKHLQEMYIQTRTEALGSFVKNFLTFGTLVSSEKHFQEIFVPAQKMRTKIKEEMQNALKKVDLIATPTVPLRSPLLEDLADNFSLDNAADFYTSAANLAGLPALSIPIKPEKGLPAGLHLTGRAFEETSLLKAFHALENI